MARPRNAVPKLTHHKSSGQARVTIGQDQYFFGRYGSALSRQRYARFLAELAALPPGVSWKDSTKKVFTSSAAETGQSVADVIFAFAAHACEHYRRADGSQTNEVRQFALACKVVRELYGDTPAASFGALALRAVREQMVARGWSRPFVNNQVRRVRHVFKWAVSHEMIPPSVHQSLSAVAGLRRGRTDERETEPVLPVAEGHVLAVLPYLSLTVAAMVRVQWLSGMRPGELVQMRPCDIDEWHLLLSEAVSHLAFDLAPGLAEEGVVLGPPLPQPRLEPVRPVRDPVRRDGVQDLLADPQT